MRKIYPFLLLIVLSILSLAYGGHIINTDSSYSLISKAAVSKATKANSMSVEEGSATKTIMFYMLGSNLESENGILTTDIQEILKAKKSDNINIVIQTGGSTKWFHNDIKSNTVQRFVVKNNKLVELSDLGAISMATPDTLSDFISFSARKYPADEYYLIMADHGGSIPLSFGVDELAPEDSLTHYAIGQALKYSNTHIDALIFDACEMCSVELFMSIYKYVDYVVAAESPTYSSTRPGSGINYTHIIDDIVKDNPNVQKICENILESYKTYDDSSNRNSSMSVIRMDRVPEIYKAYCKYLKEARNEIKKQEGYESFMQARDKSGSYEGTDAADLHTLAGRYDLGKASTRLQNAIANAVVNTYSNIGSGHGVTAYCPYSYPELYYYGRESFIKLNYRDDITDFYDLLVSKELFFNNKTQYAHSWYIDQNPNSGIKAGQKENIKYDIINNKKLIKMSNNAWSKFKRIERTLLEETSDNTGTYYYSYGTDRFCTQDDDLNILAAIPSRWLALNGVFSTTVCTNMITLDEGGKLCEYYAYAVINDAMAYICIETSPEHPDGIITGYYITDFESLDTDELIPFSDSDQVKLISVHIDPDTFEESYYYASTNIAPDKLNPYFASLNSMDESKAYMAHVITDIYENQYITPVTKIN